MTTRRRANPVLDRIITINTPMTVTTAVSGRGYLFQQWAQPSPGEYFLTGLTLWCRFPDRNGEPVPDAATIPAGTEITLEWAGMSWKGDLQHDATHRNRFGEVADDWLFLRFLDAPPDTGTSDLTIRLPGSTTTTTTVTPRRVWAARRDLDARDSLETSPDGRLIIDRSRFTIRHDDGVAVDTMLTDDEGQERTIVGISRIGRREYLELLAESIA